MKSPFRELSGERERKKYIYISIYIICFSKGTFVCVQRGAIFVEVLKVILNHAICCLILGS